MKNEMTQEAFEGVVAAYVADITDREQRMSELTDEELALVSGGIVHEQPI